MKILIIIMLSLSLFSFEIPFDANFRTYSKGDSIIYSSRLNLLEFNSSKFIYIFEQKYSTLKNEAIENHRIVYIYYW